MAFKFWGSQRQVSFDHSSLSLVNVISSNIGGGAEVLVREMHREYISRNINSYSIYLSGADSKLEKNEFILGSSPRSPVNILRIRKILQRISSVTNGKIVLHIHLTWPFYYASLACLGLPGVRIFYTEHSTNNNRRRSLVIRYIDRFIYSRFERIVCVSHGVERSLRKLYGNRISSRLITIYNGVRLYRLVDRQELGGRLPRLISVGSLTWIKNFEVTILAVACMKDKVESYTIIGVGPQLAYLTEVIEFHGLTGKVRLVGWSDEVESYLHAADLQLIPSLFEGFGLVAVEGMSTGLPVVASEVDGLREVIGESTTSVIFVKGITSVESWVQAIERGITMLNGVGHSLLARSSRKRAENFTLDEVVTRYTNIYLS